MAGNAGGGWRGKKEHGLGDIFALGPTLQIFRFHRGNVQRRVHPSSEVALPARALGRAVENLVDLSRHDEVILVQSLYFLRLQADRCIAPAEADVRMMAFGLSEFTDLLDKGPRFAKVAEPEVRSMQ